VNTRFTPTFDAHFHVFVGANLVFARSLMVKIRIADFFSAISAVKKIYTKYVTQPAKGERGQSRNMIYEWLKTAPIAPLSAEVKKEFGIE
jgi:hypothetical protein